MAGNTIRISILADSKNAVSGLHKAGDAVDDVGSKAGKAGGAFKGLKGLLAGGIAIAGTAAAIGFLKDSFQGAVDAAKATKILNNQIGNLGPAGKTAFAGAADFAQTLGDQIGVDDDAIKPVLSKLASFPDAFKAGSLGAEGMQRSTKAAFDLQAIGIGSAESNIIGIGKAMNDPIKGMSALSKSGVSFTAQQKEQITNLVKQGDLAGAQKILLSGIESNAKGAASAAATPMQKLRVTIDNLGESLAGKALPFIDKMATTISTKIIPKVSELADKYGPKISEAFKIAGAATSFLFSALSNPAVQIFAGIILSIVAAFKIYSATVQIISAVTKVWAAIQVVFNAIMLLNPVVLIVVGILLLIAVIVLVATKTKFFQTIWAAVWGAIKTAAVATFNFLKGFFVGAWNFIKNVFTTVSTAIRTAIGAVWKAIKVAAMFVFNGIKLYFTTIFAAFRTIFTGLITGLKKIWGGITFLFTKVTEVGGKVVAFFKELPGKLLAAVGRVKDKFLSLGADIINGIRDGISKAWGKLTGFVLDQLKKLPGFMQKFLGISSPSKLMADVIGHPMAEGIGVGLAAGVKKLRPDELLKPLVNSLGRTKLKTEVAVQGAADLIPSLSAGRSSAGAGSNYFTVNVAVANGVDPAEVGRKTVLAIEAWQARTGRQRLLHP